ncbi:MAG: hypothetical protein MUF34_21575 [Polyangiaceae bacterium]|nr:hypothetical protein [Polyangiaceae bacterium]
MKPSRSGSALNVLVLSFAVAVSYATSECASTSTSGFRVPTFSKGAADATGATRSSTSRKSTGSTGAPRTGKGRLRETSGGGRA